MNLDLVHLFVVHEKKPHFDLIFVKAQLNQQSPPPHSLTTHASLKISSWALRFPFLLFHSPQLPMMNIERHANLLKALTEFYSIFVQLTVIPPSVLRVPDTILGDPNAHVDAAIETC